MNSSVSPDQFFKAIQQANLEEVQAYISAKGSLDVTSPQGYAPLVDLALNLVKQKQAEMYAGLDEEEEDEFGNLINPTPVSPSTPSAELSPTMQNLCDIGILLISAGAKYDVRAGRTNRSIKLPQMMASRFPDVHRQWEAAFTKSLILSNVSQNVDLDSKKTSPQRKI